MDVPADTTFFPTIETSGNQTETEHGAIDTVEPHAAPKPIDDMPADVSEDYNAREQMTLKALRETQRDLETTLEANCIVISDRH